MNRGVDAQRKVNIPRALFAYPCQVKMTPKKYANPRNIWSLAFVYTSAAGSQAVAGWMEILKEKTPRWQPRGQ